MRRASFARNKPPTRSYWRAQLVQWLCMRDDIATTTVADMPSWVGKLTKGEAEQALTTEQARRLARDAA